MRREAGFSFVALVAILAIGLILMAAALPSWRYVIQDDREQELLFRGFQIADAIQAFRAKSGNALPPNLDLLVKAKYLRKAYKDPMTANGEWRLVHLGEIVTPGSLQAGRPGGLNSIIPSPSPQPSASPSGSSSDFGAGGGVGVSFGPIIGVASRSTAKSIRLFNGHARYNEWVFAVGQARVVGNTPELTVAQLFGGAPVPPSAPPPSVPGGVVGGIPGSGPSVPGPSPSPSS